MGRIKKDQLLVGFALESNDEINNAREKLKTKTLDAIILNSLNPYILNHMLKFLQ